MEVALLIAAVHQALNQILIQPQLIKFGAAVCGVTIHGQMTQTQIINGEQVNGIQTNGK